AAALKLHKAIPENAEFGGMAIKGKVKIEENAQKFNSFTLHGVQMAFDLDKLLERFPEEVRDAMKTSVKKLIGEEQKFWFGTDGTTYVQVTAKDWSDAKKLLEKYFSGQNTLATEAGFELTRKQLAGPANTVFMMDDGRFAYTMGQYIGEIFKNIGGFPGGKNGEPKKTEGKAPHNGVLLKPEPTDWAPAHIPAGRRCEANHRRFGPNARRPGRGMMIMKSDSCEPPASARRLFLTHSRSVMKQWVLLGVAVLALTAVTGCKRGSVVKDEKTFELTPTVPHILYIPSCKKFEVNFSAT